MNFISYYFLRRKSIIVLECRIKKQQLLIIAMCDLDMPSKTAKFKLVFCREILRKIFMEKLEFKSVNIS